MKNMLLNKNTLGTGDNVFSKYIQKNSIFKDKNALTTSFIPDRITHRDEEISKLTNVLAPVLRGYVPSNVLVYGKCGTGKTMCSKFVISQLEDMAARLNHRVKAIYINCKMKRVADTEYRLLTQLLKELEETVPDTGLPTDVLYRKFFEKIDQNKAEYIIILDEIDTLFRRIGDEFLYNLTRINQDMGGSHITIIGITNDLSFKNELDSRVRSSLSEEEIIFKPYDAIQLSEILQDRAYCAFRENAFSENVIQKCAALAAQEHGDARRALDLLRVAGEIAERMNDEMLSENHIDVAEEKINMDKTLETVRIQPKQSKLVLSAIIKQSKKMQEKKGFTDKRLLTGSVFEEYRNLCNSVGIKTLTQRRVSDLITELDMFGIISTNVVSKGRYGRTREIVINMGNDVSERIEGLLENDLF